MKGYKCFDLSQKVWERQICVEETKGKKSPRRSE